MSENKRNSHIEISERKFLLRIVDALIVTFTIYVSGKLLSINYFEETTSFPFPVIVLLAYLNFFGAIFEMYHLPVTVNRLQTIRAVILSVSVSVILYFFTPFFSPELPTKRFHFLYFYFVTLFPLLAWRWLYIKFFTSHRFMKKAVMICSSTQVYDLSVSLESVDPHYKVIAYLDLDPNTTSAYINDYKPIRNAADLNRIVEENGVYEVIVAPDANVRTINPELLELTEKGVIIKDFAYAYEMLANKIPIEWIDQDFYRYFPFSRINHNKLYLFSVRFGEFVFSIIGLVLGGLFLLPIVFLCNLIGNRGSLFYSQERVGKNGATFKIIKFRTMVKDAEKNGAAFAQKNDSRITPFGKFLRKSRIDELPQLINVLKGEMSIIGPRPERPVFVEMITEKMPLYTARHSIKPGLTGWAQINYRYTDSIEDSIEKLKYDLFYIKHRSIFMDINIIIKTIGTVVFYRGQ